MVADVDAAEVRTDAPLMGALIVASEATFRKLSLERGLRREVLICVGVGDGEGVGLGVGVLDTPPLPPSPQAARDSADSRASAVLAVVFAITIVP